MTYTVRFSGTFQEKSECMQITMERRKCRVTAKELTLLVCEVSQNNESRINAGAKQKSSCDALSKSSHPVKGGSQKIVRVSASGFLVVVSVHDLQS